MSRLRQGLPSPGLSRSGSHRAGNRDRPRIKSTGDKREQDEPADDTRGPDDLRKDRDRVLAMFDLSAETIARLDRFVHLLLTWQRQTNLIAPSTVPSLWTRHVADSLQLLDLVDSPYERPRVWFDLGSGGGFPGMVIACALTDVSGTQVHLVESNLKKAAFLREAIRETKAPAMVHAARIESLQPTLDAITVDYVTARALAPLPHLLEMIEPFTKKGAKALLLKGQDLDHELTESTKDWHIEAESVPSRTSKAGQILVVRSLSRRTLSKRFHISPASSGE
jgi:16S rRNA (guanine527-N7)-methyltransferase